MLRLTERKFQMCDKDKFLRKEKPDDNILHPEPELFTNNLKPDTDFVGLLLFTDKTPDNMEDFKKYCKEFQYLKTKNEELNKSLRRKFLQITEGYQPVLDKTASLITTYNENIKNFLKIHLKELDFKETSVNFRQVQLGDFIIEIEEKIKLKAIPIK